MKQRAGKMRNMFDLKNRNIKVYEVKTPLDYSRQQTEAYHKHIREYCRRGNWAQITLYERPYLPRMGRRYKVYVFANEQDALMFKMCL